MLNLPEHLVLKSSRVKWFFVTFGGLVFVFGGFLMISSGDEPAKAWLVTLFFAAVALIGLFQLIKPMTLELGPDGFVQRTMGRTMSYRWDEVSEFGVYTIRTRLIATNSFVNFTPLSKMDTKTAKVSRALTGGAAQLSDTFGFKAHELAEVMNQYRQKALSQN